MKRKDFLKKASFGLIGSAVGASVIGAANDPQKHALTEQVGFNHLPNKEATAMNTEATVKTLGKSVLHKANTRGHANHGWLNSHHSFSFANYYNPDRMSFGVLRVLNDDRVAPGRGFGTHPHDNMEIISIPLQGDLEHKDSMGNVAVIRQGDVQAMSAGTGIYHSEYNRNPEQEVKFLQIWVLPNKRGVEPRYDQITLDPQDTQEEMQQILSPNPDDAGVWIHQNAWFHIVELEAGQTTDYQFKDAPNNGVYSFVLEGDVTVNGQALNARDGYGVWETNALKLSADTKTRVLLMEVPMNLG
ncbi:MAG: pirin family protein [Bacteroidota bacterium]